MGAGPGACLCRGELSAGQNEAQQRQKEVFLVCKHTLLPSMLHPGENSSLCRSPGKRAGLSLAWLIPRDLAAQAEIPACSVCSSLAEMWLCLWWQ